MTDMNKKVEQYHSSEPRGKISVNLTKKLDTLKDISLAYTPGVGHICEKIAKNPEDAYKYTAKGHLVGIVTNGTAVLGFGDIGPEAAKPVMEGKANIYKKFTNTDVFDLEINSHDVADFCKTVKSLEPTFGGIHIEDIKAPECFAIESYLKKNMNIPVFHDDQHATAVVVTAALINYLKIFNLKIEDINLICVGAGAAALASLKLLRSLGLKHVHLFDSKGLVTLNRRDINSYKKEFAIDSLPKDIPTVMKGADVFLGLSVPNTIDANMVKTMSKHPLIMALANPYSEIDYDDAKAVVKDQGVVATGRSDHPNQVNNAVAFPYIMRGALDVRATDINDAMFLAAAKAIAYIASNHPENEFSTEYIIPTMLDPDLKMVQYYVAKAAIETGVVPKDFHFDLSEYKKSLK